jgi:hypothetical protein
MRRTERQWKIRAEWTEFICGIAWLFGFVSIGGYLQEASWWLLS